MSVGVLKSWSWLSAASDYGNLQHVMTVFVLMHDLMLINAYTTRLVVVVLHVPL